ncbi:MAG TPA: aconitate hydratase AcnA [Acidimicrobiales bacterium]|jgi:aconitate hydratase|nr:aconitate hydratase AcnA [Acidimicrobiales bacterium]
MAPSPSSPSAPDSFGARSDLAVGDRSYQIFRINALADRYDVARLPYSIKVVLENLLRHEDGIAVSAQDIEAVADWGRNPERHGVGGSDAAEIALTPERVLMQDFTGVPGVVDLAAMRDALAEMGGDPAKVNPLVPVELVIDHSVIAEVSGTPDSFDRNVDIEYQRNIERYQLLRWAQQAFDGFRVVPPGAGICHQVNLEYLSRVVFGTEDGRAYCDTLVGTDSHTTMVNGLGVLGWGVGGIEAEAAMLGQPLSMLLPPVVGFRLTGSQAPGTTATDLVLTITQLLRQRGVVGKFVEFYGPGLAAVALANRATIGNMSPEYGATCAIFPIDDVTLDYLRFTGRDDHHVALVEAYAKEQGMFHVAGGVEPVFSETIELDLSTVVPSIAGPSRPQDLVPLSGAKDAFRTALGGAKKSAPATLADGSTVDIEDGHVVIAAITSCTNTSNPQVMVAAGMLAKKAIDRGLRPKPWVKTSLAPGSRVVMDYFDRAGLTEPLAQAGFDLVGFGCTTCIGNSGPLLTGVSEAVVGADLSAVSVLSGNRNFEGRIHPEVRMNYLASPPLVVAYALAGTMDIDLMHDSLGTDTDGNEVHLADLWPSSEEVTEAIRTSLTSEMFRDRYSSIFDGEERWQTMETATGNTFRWDGDSTYVLRPPFLEHLAAQPTPVTDIQGARVLAVLGDSVTTDHISPAGSIGPSTPAGHYLSEHGVERKDFNSYGSRRGNHEVMMRGTFANVRLRNQLAPGTEGGITLHLPDGEQTTIFEASVAYAAEGVPLVVLAGKEYGSGSSRDWAAKGTALLGVRAVIAASYERIHRSNLIGMGVLPLQFADGQSAATLGLTGHEVFAVSGIESLNQGDVPKEVAVRAAEGDRVVEFAARLRIDTPMEAEYYRNGGILPYMLRQMAG